jgi:hypothetical protein
LSTDTPTLSDEHREAIREAADDPELAIQDVAEQMQENL